MEHSIKTERLDLQPLSEVDFDFIQTLRTRPEYFEYENDGAYNDDEIAKKIKELGLDLPSINQLEAGLALVVLITIILAVAIVINVTAIETKIGGPESPNIYAMQYLSDNYPTLNVWFMKQKDQKNTFYLLDEFNNHLIDNMIEAIKENNPSYFETHPEGDLKDFFKLNTMLYHR